MECQFTLLDMRLGYLGWVTLWIQAGQDCDTVEDGAGDARLFLHTFPLILPPVKSLLGKKGVSTA